MNPLLTKTRQASGAISACRFVKTTDNGIVAKCTGTTAPISGISDQAGDVADGERVDVHEHGNAVLELGGTVAANAYVTSDANGKGVAAAPAQGVNAHVGALTLDGGGDGDLVPVKIVSFVMQGA